MNKYWNPAQFGEHTDNEVKAYTVAIPNLPMLPNKRVKKFIEWISKLEGFIGFRPEYPHGTLLIFDTENHAKVGRNRIKTYPEYEGGVGNNICEVYIPKEYMKRKI